MGAKKKGSGKKKAQKAASNVFAMFSQSQIQEYKEGFNMIDQNRDGFIDQDDLHNMYASLGTEQKPDILEAMIKEATGPINFTMFLTLFGGKLNGTDPEDVIKNAFKCFDDTGAQTIPGEHLKQLLMSMGDRMTTDELTEMFNEVPCDDAGNFDYVEFCRVIKHGPKEEE